MKKYIKTDCGLLLTKSEAKPVYKDSTLYLDHSGTIYGHRKGNDYLSGGGKHPFIKLQSDNFIDILKSDDIAISKAESMVFLVSRRGNIVDLCNEFGEMTLTVENLTMFEFITKESYFPSKQEVR